MDSQQKTQNDIAWEALFAKYNILNKIDNCGQYIISAAQIKEFREPRLMAKFDHQINLPLIFSNNHLAILQHRIFFHVFSFCQQYGKFPERATIVKMMKEADLYNIESENTYLRRASTVSGWINWMFGLIS